MISRDILFSVNQLNFGYGPTPLFVDADISIRKNETVRLIGANGSGKTTLLKILAGSLDQGVRYDATWCGKVLNSITDVRQCVSFAVDTPPLFQELSCRENIHVMQLLWGLTTGYVNEVERLCMSMEMDTNMWEQPAKSCSLGTQHKLFLAVVLARPASLYLLDEPFNTLDRESRDVVTQRITHDRDHAYLIVSHLAQAGLEFDRTIDIRDLAGRQGGHEFSGRDPLE